MAISICGLPNQYNTILNNLLVRCGILEYLTLIASLHEERSYSSLQIYRGISSSGLDDACYSLWCYKSLGFAARYLNYGYSIENLPFKFLYSGWCYFLCFSFTHTASFETKGVGRKTKEKPTIATSCQKKYKCSKCHWYKVGYIYNE